MIDKMVELLAPAGSFECFRAAINAGADAIYLGGNAFGARAYANNFDETELLKALDYAHLYNKKVYLTVNTLFKENELEDRLYNYLLPYYKEGLDAVIVQDFGAFDFIKNNFKGLPIHASTQMAVTGVNSAKLLKEMNATRIVPARELSLEDLKEIDDNVDIEIESFVHGALCYCYSGQCLMSSMIGGRSGNRGRCAQPCRMLFNNSYPMSMKDMCTLSIIPEIIKSGVDSFKIEGRMKSSEYVAGVVAIYRKYLDRALGSDAAYKVNDKDIIDLMDLYNRGGFTKGYYTNEKGLSMIAINRPNHQGNLALLVEHCNKGKAYCKALTDLHSQDVFEIDKDFNYTIGENYKKNSEVILNLPKNYRIKEGKKIYRIRCNELIDALTKKYIDADLKIKLKAEVILKCGQKAQINVIKGENLVTVLGEEIQIAKNQPVTKEDVIKRISKTNDTIFLFENIKVEIDDTAFIPMGQLNQLKREALEKISERICSDYKREESGRILSESLKNQNEKPLLVNVMFDSLEVFEDSIKEVLNSSIVDGTYWEENFFDSIEKLSDMVIRVHASNKKFYLSLPYVVKGKTIKRLSTFINKIKENNIDIDGFLVRNLESARLLKEVDNKAPVITDANLYTMNQRAVNTYKNIFTNMLYDTISYELNEREIKLRGETNSELVVYGKFPVMLSENCIKRTNNRCDAKNGTEIIKDRKNASYIVSSRCKDCYCITYNSKPVFLMDELCKENAVKPGYARLIFTDENSKIIRCVLENVKKMTEGIADCSMNLDSTKGHFDKGVM